jgi:TolA-binding protein
MVTRRRRLSALPAAFLSPARFLSKGEGGGFARARRVLLLPLAACLLLWAAPPVSAQDLSRVLKKLNDVEADINQLSSLPLRRSQLRSATYVEERLADGELYFRLKDYVRASIILTDVVDSYPRHAAYPDCLFLLAESLYHAGDYLGARTRFRLIIDRANEGRFRPFLQRTLGRLIEIAIITRDFDRVEDYFERLSQLPTSEIEAATSYFRAKYLYSVSLPEGQDTDPSEGGASYDQQRLEQARLAFASVPANTTYFPQSRYYIGVIYTLRGQYEQAVQAFRQVAGYKATDADGRKVVDLGKLALGRIYYETDQIEKAARAYQSVGRSSSDFDTALYEIAWAYIRNGDTTQAERALEVLAVAVPDSRNIPDGMILRGNLLLRNGSYVTADEVFKDVTDRFDKVREQLDEVYADQPDPGEYFRQLVRENVESFDISSFVPPLALKWTELGGDIKHALQILSDLSQSVRLVRETENIAKRMTAALSSPNPVNIFPDLRSHRERTVALRTRLEKIRKELIAAEARVSGTGGSELAATRKQRQALEKRLDAIPDDPDEMHARNAKILERFAELNRQLSQLEVQSTGLEARIVATDRFVNDTMKERKDAEAVAAIHAELEQHRGAVAQYRDRIATLRMDVENGQLQVGVGDGNYRSDGELREKYRALVEKERKLSGGGKGGDNVYYRIVQAEARIDEQDARVDAVVAERVRDMRAVIDEERANLARYREQLDVLQDEAEVVIGAVTRENYAQIRQRFYEIVLQADVGRADVAWADREEHRMRVEMLTRDRTRQLQALDDEFREIMDEKAKPESREWPGHRTASALPDAIPSRDSACGRFPLRAA